MTAVAQHGDAIHDPGHLVEAVRDVHDRDAIGTQFLDDAKKLGRLGLGQGRRGFVHDEHACIQ